MNYEFGIALKFRKIRKLTPQIKSVESYCVKKGNILTELSIIIK